MTMNVLDFDGHVGPETPREERLLLACSTSDVPTITELLKETDINFECVDLLGRTPLQLAIENDDIEVTKLLLPISDEKNVENCLLLAIAQFSENLAMAILKHPVYIAIEAKNKEKKEDSFYNKPSSSKFPANTTPLILAADKNLYEVVRHLLVNGHVIPVPHSLVCSCEICSKKSQGDYFRFAHERLNAYRGLASESYLSLSSEDPILDAFKLRRTLLNLSEKEEHFKNEYCELAKNLSAFSVKLLNKVIGDRELDAVLNKVDDSAKDLYSPLARLKLAVKLEEKRFVAHPSSQMRMKKRWYEGFEALSDGQSMLKQGAVLVMFLVCYIFFALAYIVAPKWKRLQFMRAPCAKFVSHVFFYLIQLFLLLFLSIDASPYRALTDTEWDVSSANITGYFRSLPSGELVIRNGQGSAVLNLIFVWVLALLWQEAKELYRDGWREYLSSVLNWMDAIMLLLYSLSFGFRFYTVSKVRDATSYFRCFQYFIEGNTTVAYTPIELLRTGNTEAKENYYWLNPDRFDWDQLDPLIVSEGLFSMANVLDFARFASLLPAFEALGTLQISFSIMMRDIFRFSGLFILVFLAFVVGLANLYWFFGETTRKSVELTSHPASDAEVFFGDLSLSFKFCFWSLFGMGERDATELKTFRQFDFTEIIGFLMYGLLMVCGVTVLLNLLIAMMSLSFSIVQEDADVEWKFSRTQLFMDYMLPGSTLPVPLNIIPTPKSIYYALRKIRRFCTKKNKTQDSKEDLKEAINSSSGPDTNRLGGLTGKLEEASTNVSHDESVIPPEMHEMFKYKAVISRLVHRFISDSVAVKEEDSDDDLKQDVLRMRMELTNALELRAREIEQCRQEVDGNKIVLQKDLGNCRELIQRLDSNKDILQKDIGSCLRLIERLDSSLQQLAISVQQRQGVPEGSATATTENVTEGSATTTSESVPGGSTTTTS